MRPLRWCGLFLLQAAALNAASTVDIVLTRDFIEAHKNRVTMSATYTVEKVHDHPNPQAKDGDIHVAGHAPEIGLTTVAEVMNARDEPAVVTKLNAVEGTGTTVSMEGVWRIWCEHAPVGVYRQGDPPGPFPHTNPDHVFELHPVTTLDGDSLLDTLKHIPDFHYKPAFESFRAYRRTPATIVPGEDDITIKTRNVGFNYVDFKIRLDEDPTFEVPDGRFVRATVLDHDEETLVSLNKRMVFAKDSAPEVAVRSLHKGDVMHVAGIPRIDLAIVAWRARVGADRPEVLTWPLPYEMIIVGLLEDEDDE